MEFSTETISAPFKSDTEGVVRVGGTRVTLDTVISAFKNGSTCEEIVFQFPVLKLADVYSAISYYLNHQDAVEAYLEQHERIADKIKKKYSSPNRYERYSSAYKTTRNEIELIGKYFICQYN